MKILIVGAGFGGLFTALALSQYPWKEERPQITLVDREDRFLFVPLLYELLTGELQTWEIAPPLVEVLEGTGVEFIQGEVKAIDPDQQACMLTDGRTLEGDYLVVAIGGQTPSFGIRGVTEYALPFRTLAHAQRVEQRLRELEQKEYVRVAIVGAGASGVELACKIGDRLGSKGVISLLDRADIVLPNFDENLRKPAIKALEDRDVHLMMEKVIEEITEEGVVYRSVDGEVKETLPAGLILWTVGTAVPELVTQSSLEKDERGYIQVTSTLQSSNYPRVFALGDLASCPLPEGKKAPLSAQVAYQQADFCAWNLWASIHKRPLLEFRYFELGTLISLGTTQAAASILGYGLSGPVAHILRRLVYLGRMPSSKHQWQVGVNWLSDALVRNLRTWASS
jgi:NADH:ubiquinone reductase (non-electrogenic)